MWARWDLPVKQTIHFKLIKIWDFVVICTVYNTFTVLGTKPGTKIALAVWMAKIELPHIPNESQHVRMNHYSTFITVHLHHFSTTSPSLSLHFSSYEPSSFPARASLTPAMSHHIFSLSKIISPITTTSPSEPLQLANELKHLPNEPPHPSQ